MLQLLASNSEAQIFSVMLVDTHLLAIVQGGTHVALSWHCIEHQIWRSNGLEVHMEKKKCETICIQVGKLPHQKGLSIAPLPMLPLQCSHLLVPVKCKANSCLVLPCGV